MMAEGDVSVFNLDELRFFECGVEGLFLFPSLSCFLLVVVVGFGECVDLVLKGVITVVAIITVCNAEGELGVEESWGEKEDTFSLRWAACSANMHLQSKTGKVAVDEGQTFGHVFSGGKNEGSIVHI